MGVVIVIPARFESSRLLGKPMALIHGKPMITHVVERAKMIPNVNAVIVATDSDIIAKTAKAAGVWATVTGPANSGTDRVALVTKDMPDDTIVLNIQGDLPFFNPEVGRELINQIHKDRWAGIATPVIKVGCSPCSFHDVKVTFGIDNTAMMFSRQPNTRDLSGVWYKHIGVYAFRNHVLQHFTSLPQSSLEIAEGLEQLRALENGIPIRIVEVPVGCGQEVNTPADLVKANAC